MKSTVALALSLAVNLTFIVGLPHHGHFRPGHPVVLQHQRVARTVAKPALIPNSDLFFIKRSLSSLEDPKPNPDAMLVARSNGEDEEDCDDEEQDEDDASSSSSSPNASTAQTPAATTNSTRPMPSAAYVKPADTTPTYTSTPSAPASTPSSTSVDASVSLDIGSSSSSSSSSYTDSSSSYSSETYTGKATFFYQGGVAGACGTVHSDADFIVAIDSALYDNGKFCGKSILLTRVSTGKSITVTGADECPGCSSSGSLDMSTGAFDALGTADEGVFDISWKVIS